MCNYEKLGGIKRSSLRLNFLRSLKLLPPVQIWPRYAVFSKCTKMYFSVSGMVSRDYPGLRDNFNEELFLHFMSFYSVIL